MTNLPAATCFHGFCVRKLSDTVAELGEDIVIVIAFASQRPEVLQLMYVLEDKIRRGGAGRSGGRGPLFDERISCAHQDEMQCAYDLLADDLSRAFLDTVRFKLSGKMGTPRHSDPTRMRCFIDPLPGPQEHFSGLRSNGDTIRELLHTDGESPLRPELTLAAAPPQAE